MSGFEGQLELDDDEYYDDGFDDDNDSVIDEELARCKCGAARVTAEGRIIQVADCVC
jgi:hypothetical protein